MKRPEKARIGPFNYDILSMDRDEADQHEAHGMCNRSTLIIKIADGLKPSIEGETLLHELMHAMWVAGNLSISEGVKEEDAVSALSIMMASAMRDNPKLFEYIKARLSE